MFTALVLAAGLSAAASAQTDFTRLSRAEALERYEAIGEETMEAFSLIYTRVDPQLAEYIGSWEWDEIDREAAACAYDMYARSGELDNLATALQAAEATSDRVREDESITMIAMLTGAVDQSVLTPEMPAGQQERNIEVSLACGVVQASSRRFSDPQLMQRLMAQAEQAQ
jgi:hypothetical protein